MGGRPLAMHVPALTEHGVHSVVNMTCEYAGPQKTFAASGIVQLRLPTLDFTEPSVEDLIKGIRFIQERLVAEDGGRVYVHCKAGRARAACMVLCTLIAMEGMEGKEAFQAMKDKRPVVEKILLTYSSVQAFSSPEHQPSRDSCRKSWVECLSRNSSILTKGSSSKSVGSSPLSAWQSVPSTLSVGSNCP